MQKSEISAPLKATVPLKAAVFLTILCCHFAAFSGTSSSVSGYLRAIAGRVGNRLERFHLAYAVHREDACEPGKQLCLSEMRHFLATLSGAFLCFRQAGGEPRGSWWRECAIPSGARMPAGQNPARQSAGVALG